MLYPNLLPHLYLAQEILQRFTVRIHSRIIEQGELESRSWVRLWYLLRFIDDQGQGYIRIPLADICQILAAGESTGYQWLREGKDAGAFRWWKIRRGKLRVALGGLFAVCKALGLKPPAPQKKKRGTEHKIAAAQNRIGISTWGVTAQVPVFCLSSLQNFRAAATAAATLRLQQLSRYAAWRALPESVRNPVNPATGEKEAYHLPQPSDLFRAGASFNP